MSMQMNQMEQLLRRSAGSQRQQAPARVRPRIMNAVRESDHAVMHSPAFPRRAMLAFCALVLCTMVAAYSIFMQREGTQPVELHANRNPIRLELASLSRIPAQRVEKVERMLVEPMRTEWQRMTRDAERVIETWQDEITSVPKVFAAAFRENESETNGSLR